MPLHTLPKVVRRKKRIGRGIGSRGAKSGRGQKGQKSRAGAHTKAGFEGGQTPLYMRLPKARGSKQKFPSQVVKPQAISSGVLNRFAANAIVGPGQLYKAGLVADRYIPIKLIAGRPVDRKLTVRVHRVSKGASALVEQSGGKVELIKKSE